MIEILSQKNKKDIAAHALESKPQECCGLIVSKGDKSVVVRCNNEAVDPTKNFEISARDYIRVQKYGADILAYYHSHVKDEKGAFSDIDKKVSLAHGIPAIMYNIKTDNFFQYTAK